MAGKEQEASYIAGGNEKWHGHVGKQISTVAKNKLPYDSTIVLIGIYPKDMKVHVHTKICT